MVEKAVPVIRYHSVGIPNRNWQWNYLTVPYNVFENQLKWMKKKEFHTVSLQQLYNYMNERANLPKNSVVLTFDDGYLDNWVFAYPLLKKYGFNGTIYINPEFVDPRDIIRKNLEDFWKKEAEIDKLETTGYLSWTEMEEMEKERIIDIQSHTMSHTWYPTSNKIIDFRHPDDPYIWMTWNNNPTKKPFLQSDKEELVRFGKPVYENGRAIGVRRYFPDKQLDDFMVHHVKENGGKDFFFIKNWRDKLFEILQKYKAENSINERNETKKEYEKRIYYELKKSKELIENKLHKEVKFLCWPGGAVTDKALKIASDIGYISSTIGKDIKSTRKHLKNKYGEDASRINRIGPSLYWDGIEGIESKIKYKNGYFLVLSLYRFQGRKIVAPLYILLSKAGVGLYKMRYEIFRKRKEKK